MPGGMFPYIYVPEPSPSAGGEPSRPRHPHPGAERLPLGDIGFFCAGLPVRSHAEYIMTAAMQGDTDRIRRLLTHPANLPDFPNAYGITPLMAAAAHGHADTVAFLSGHVLTDINRTCKAALAALHYAAHWGRAGCVETLLRQGADFTCGLKPAYLFSCDRNVQEAFQGDRKFARHMESPPRQEAVAQAAPGQRMESPPEDENPEDKNVKKKSRDYDHREFLSRTIVHDNGRNARFSLDVEKTAQRLIAAMPDMEEAQLQKVFSLIRPGTRIFGAFPWAHIFVEAARCGNIPVMVALHNNCRIDRQDTLDDALAAVVDAGDDRQTAHVLLLMGADAGSRCMFLPLEPGDPPERFRIYQRALLLERGGILEEMALWSDGLSGFGQKEIARAALEVNRPLKTVAALRVCAEKTRARGLSGRKLRTAFKEAVGKGYLEGMMALYAEGCHSRLFREESPLALLDKGTLRLAFVLALENERHDFAVKMLADGYSPAGAEYYPLDADFLASKNVSAQARNIFRKAVSGSLKLTPIISTSGRGRAPYTPPYLA